MNVEEEENLYGPIQMDQSFIPETWIKYTVKENRNYYGTPAYIDQTSGLMAKRPLSHAAFTLLKRFPFLKDYKYMMDYMEAKGFSVENDFEAFLAGQAISAKNIKENLNRDDDVFKSQVSAESSRNTAEFYKNQWDSARKELRELQEHYADINNNPQIIRDLEQARNERNALQAEKEDILHQNELLQQEVANYYLYKQAVENGTIGNLYNEVQVMLDDKDRAYSAQINNLNATHTEVINSYKQQVFELQSQVSSLSMQVSILQQDSKQEMDKLVLKTKLKHLSDSSDIAATKAELLKFIDGVLGVYDSAMNGVQKLGVAIKRATEKAKQVSDNTLNIMPLFNDVKFPKFSVAKEKAEEMKEKLSDKYKVEEQSVVDFINSDKLPDLPDQGENLFAPL